MSGITTCRQWGEREILSYRMLISVVHQDLAMYGMISLGNLVHKRGREKARRQELLDVYASI